MEKWNWITSTSNIAFRGNENTFQLSTFPSSCQNRIKDNPNFIVFQNRTNENDRSKKTKFSR